MAKRLSHEEFLSKLNKTAPSISTIGMYENSRTKILVSCDICGYQWSVIPSDLLRGHGCPRCSGKERKTTARFREEVSNISKTIEVLGEYINTATKIDVRCKICGHTWKASPSTLLSGNGCPSCGGTRRKTKDEFVSILSSINPNIELIGDYTNNRTKTLVRCLRCGYEWSATPHNLIDARSRCPKCTHSSTSFIEQFIFEWLKAALGADFVLHRDTYAIGLELDVYVPSLNLAFEPGAWHWHKDKRKIDLLKKKYCKDKGIRLITIYDKVPEDKIFKSEDVFLFPYDIRVKKKSNQLEKLLINILREQGVETEVLDIALDEVVNKAYSNSVKTDTHEFEDKLKEKGINVDVLGIYKSSSSRIKVRCKTCGHIWSPQADTLLSGNSHCRMCGIKRNGEAHRKNHKQFVKEVEQCNPTVEVLGRYIKASERIHVKCRICGNEWTPIANSLVRKKPSSCPECGKKKMIRSRLDNKKN